VDRLARAVLAGRELNEDAGLDARAELAQFDVVARAFHRTPRRGRRARRRQEPLAFGVEGITAAVTALVLAVAVDVLSQLARDRTRRTMPRVTAWFRRVVLRRPVPLPPPDSDPDAEPTTGPMVELTPEQMRTIHRVARRHARRMRVPAATAEAIANGIVAELAMSNGSGEPSRD
jgi:hypothetical protein